MKILPTRLMRRGSLRERGSGKSDKNDGGEEGGLKTPNFRRRHL